MQIFLFGSTTRASDWRILISLAVDFGAAYLIYKVAEPCTYEEEECPEKAVSIYMVGGLALITSHNYMHTLCLKAPFAVVNEELEKQRNQADIVFADLKPENFHK